nr:hypothetical protein [Micromonospora sp. DSM 115978]
VDLGYHYHVYLLNCRTSAEVLDWIFHLRAKRMDVSGFLQALEDVLDPQRRLCSFGTDKRLTVADVRQLVKDFRSKYTEPRKTT